MAERQFKFEVYVDYEDGEPESEPATGTQKEIKQFILDALKEHRKGHELDDYLFYTQVVSKRAS